MKLAPAKFPASVMIFFSRTKFTLVLVVSEKVVEMALAWPASSFWVVEIPARR